jgi:hypothetical protein
VERRNRLIDTVCNILADHIPDDQGWCAGCLRQWDRWMPWAGCPQVTWARSVVETHGNDDWDQTGVAH